MAAAPRPLELTRLAAEHLAGRGVEDPRLDAELLLAHVLGVRRLDLYLQFERPLEPDEVAAYREAVRRRARREPLQYITGEAAFREVVLKVDPRVLIPRPETEVLVGEVLAWARQAAERAGIGAPVPGASGDEPGGAVERAVAGPGSESPGRSAAGGAGGAGGLVALDIGTGSGAIAVSLLVEGPFARLVATDVSADALDVARENGERCRVADRLELRQGSLWAAVGDGERFDVIVANPPYVAESERETLMPEVVEHEPGEALFSGPDGLLLVKQIVAGAGSRLEPGGLLALELGVGQAPAVVALLREAGFASPRVVEDLSGRERVVLATRN